jgi:hypothetical protein
VRESKADGWICLAALAAFVYFFFVAGPEPVYGVQGTIDTSGVIQRDGELLGLSYATIVFIGPLIFILFLCLMVFSQELRDVTVWGLVFIILVLLKTARHRLKLRFILSKEDS